MSDWVRLEQAAEISGLSEKSIFMAAFLGRIRARMRGGQEEIYLPDVPRRYTLRPPRDSSTYERSLRRSAHVQAAPV